MNPQKQTEALCRKLKPIIGDQADMLWHMYLSEDDLGRRKVAQDIEIIAERYLKEQPLEDKQILLEPPSEKDSKGNYLLGDIFYNKKKLHQLNLTPRDFIKQIGIFAMTGEGKTNLAYLLALQLLKTKIPFTVIDWKRSWRNLLTSKDNQADLKKVQVYTIGRDTIPFLWNVFRAPPGTDKESWISTISETLERSHLSGPGVAYHFNNIFSRLFKDLPEDFYPNFFDGIRELKNTRVVARELNWKQTALRIFQSFTLGTASEVFNSRNPIKLEEILSKPVILELDLEMPKPVRVFFSELILRWIHLYRLSQGESDELKHVLFLEEVHNLFSNTNTYNDNHSIENIYREIRGFGQGIVSITQHPSLLPIELLGNCHTQIYLGLQHADDIKTARKALFLDYDEDFYLNTLNIGECIVKVKNRIEPCLVKIPLVDIQKELVTDDWLKVHGLNNMFREYAWKDDDNKNYLSLKNSVTDILSGKNHDSGDSDVRNTYFKRNSSQIIRENTIGYTPMPPSGNTSVERSSPPNPGNKAPSLLGVNKKKKVYPRLTHPQQKLLIDILENPFSTITSRYKRLRLYSKLGNSCRKELISEMCIMPRKIITGQGWITLFEITRKGKLLLHDLGHEFKNEREGIVHKFWKYKVSEYYKKLGLDVRVEEYYLNGRPDIIVIKNGKKIAIEIETGKSDYIKNIELALEANFDEIICVTINRFVEEKIRRKLEEKGISDKRIRIVGIKGFDVKNS